MNNQNLWKESDIIKFINQYDLLRGYHKRFEIKKSLDFYKKHATLFRIDKAEKKHIDPEKVKSIFLNHYGIEEEILSSKSRKGDIVKYRQILQYLLVNLTKLTSITIGEMFPSKNKDNAHCNILHNAKTVQNRFDTETDFRMDIMKLLEKFNF